MKTCPHCGTENRPGASFCRHCSRRLPATPAGQVCPRCGRQNPADALFCNGCSYAFTGVLPATPNQTGLLSPQSLLSDRYRILGRVGQGGMGAVYQAEDIHLAGNTWAIKEMSDAALTDAAERAEALEAFRREARFLAALDHPNLPKVVDSFEDGGKQYLVMEFVDGQTLEEIAAAAGRPLPEDLVLALGEDLCRVLEYLHGQQPPIIFRDLKPANIMIDRAGMVKLIDFGIARLFTPGKSRDTTSLGTRGYAAPEQYGKGQTDARSDIYALGATLHFLLTLRDPANDPLNFPAVRALNPSVSPALNDVIMRAVAVVPGQRWPSAAEMRRALTRRATAPADAAPRPSTSLPAVPRQPAPRPLAPRPPAPQSPSSAPQRVKARLAPPPPVAPAAPPRPADLRENWWFYLLTTALLSALAILLQETGIFGALFPVAWFTLSLVAGVLLRQFGAIAFTWLSIPVYNMITGQPNVYSWTVMLSLIVPIELFFLGTAYRYYTPLTMLLASALGILGLWVVANPGFNDLVLAAGGVAIGTIVAYLIGDNLNPLLT